MRAFGGLVAGVLVACEVASPPEAEVPTDVAGARAQAGASAADALTDALRGVVVPGVAGGASKPTLPLVDPTAPPGLVLSEVMPFPRCAGGDDRRGIYVEVHNPTPDPIRVDTVALEIGGVVHPLEPVVETLPPGTFQVIRFYGVLPDGCTGIARQANVSLDGPLDLGVWRILQDGVVVDEVDLTEMPWRTRVAMQAIDPSHPANNDTVAGWCPAPSSEDGGVLWDARGTPARATRCDPAVTSFPTCEVADTVPTSWRDTTFVEQVAIGFDDAAARGICTRQAVSCVTPTGEAFQHVRVRGEDDVSKAYWFDGLGAEPAYVGGVASAGTIPCGDARSARWAGHWFDPVAVDCPVSSVVLDEAWVGGCTERCTEQLEVVDGPTEDDACVRRPREARLHDAPRGLSVHTRDILAAEVADLDADGRGDLFLHELWNSYQGWSWGRRVWIHHGTPADGGLGLPLTTKVRFPFDPAASEPSPLIFDVALADVDGDGTMDVVGVFHDPVLDADGVSWMRGPLPLAEGGERGWVHDDTWLVAQPNPLVHGVRTLFPLDLDGDGSDEILQPVAGPMGSQFLQNDPGVEVIEHVDGVGLVASLWLPTTRVATVWAVALDGDAADEVVVYDGEAGELLLFDGPDTTTPRTAAVAVVRVPESPDVVLTTDATGDGVPDLVVSAASAGVGGEVWVIEGPLLGTFDVAADAFAQWVSDQVGARAGYAMLLADVDGDGMDELVVSTPRDDGPPLAPCAAMDAQEAELMTMGGLGVVDVVALPVPPGDGPIPAATRYTGDHRWNAIGVYVAADDHDGDGRDELWLLNTSRVAEQDLEFFSYGGDVRFDLMDVCLGEPAP